MPLSRRIGQGPRELSAATPAAALVTMTLLSLSALACLVAEYAAPTSARLWLADAGWTLGAVIAIGGVTVAGRRSPGHDRVGWWLLGAGCVAWLAGQLFWDVYTAASFPSSPNPADVCWLAFAVLAAAGVHRLCQGAADPLDVSLLDMLPLIVAVGALVVALLAPELRASPLSSAGRANAVAYPIFYVSGALVVLQSVVAGAVDLRRNHGILALVAGLVLTAVGFIMWAPPLLANTYAAGTNVVDALWTVGMMTIGLAALAARPVVTLPGARDLNRRRRGVLPALVFVVLAGVLTFASASRGLAVLALSAGLWVVGVTLIAQGSVLRRRQEGLLARLHARERELRDANAQLNDVNSSLSRDSRRDALTGLGNRLRLREDFAELTRAGRSEGYCVVLFDLDRFKNYNDEHGHQAGDRVLIHVGELLSEKTREGEAAYRYGGEELLLVLRGHDLRAGRAAAERQREALQRAAIEHSSNVPHAVVTCSAGVALARSGETPEQVLRRADRALYEAKAQGRNRVAVADSETAPVRSSAGALSHA